MTGSGDSNRTRRRSELALGLFSVIALLVVLSAVAMTLRSESAVAALSKYCGHTYGGDNIFVGRVGCTRARRVVRAWAHGYKRDAQINRTARGFTCRGRNDQVEGLVVVCHRNRRRISFYANVP